MEITVALKLYSLLLVRMITLTTQDIVSEFEEHEIPLDVVVLDMDWHITFYDGTKDSVNIYDL